MQSEVLEWSSGFAAFCARFAHRSLRVESRRRMGAYVRGLLGEVERKNGWTLAEAAGDTGPEGMQRLLNFYSWDCEGLRDDVREVVVETIGDADKGVLIIDETGFLKKGTRSAGVARQYSGTAGRIDHQERDRTRPLPGARVPGLVPAHHLVDGRGRLPDDPAPRRSKRGSETGVKELIPLTINEIRRLSNRVACPVRHPLVHVWHWSNWRRASQARARASHYKHRHHKLPLQY